jgi:hypothetical protein
MAKTKTHVWDGPFLWNGKPVDRLTHERIRLAFLKAYRDMFSKVRALASLPQDRSITMGDFRAALTKIVGEKRMQIASEKRTQVPSRGSHNHRNRNVR